MPVPVFKTTTPANVTSLEALKRPHRKLTAGFGGVTVSASAF
jgi:hypothetical protein